MVAVPPNFERIFLNCANICYYVQVMSIVGGGGGGGLAPLKLIELYVFSFT